MLFLLIRPFVSSGHDVFIRLNGETWEARRPFFLKRRRAFLRRLYDDKELSSADYGAAGFLFSFVVFFFCDFKTK